MSKDVTGDITKDHPGIPSVAIDLHNSLFVNGHLSSPTARGCTFRLIASSMYVGSDRSCPHEQVNEMIELNPSQCDLGIEDTWTD